MEPKLKPLNTDKFHRANSMRMTHFADIPAGTKIEDVKSPEFWAHHTKMIRPRHHIEADWEDGSRLMLLRVVSVGLNTVKVQVLHTYDFGVEAKQAPNNLYKVEWKGPVHKHSIIRLSDSEYVADGFDSKELANEHLNTMILGKKAA